MARPRRTRTPAPVRCLAALAAAGLGLLPPSHGAAQATPDAVGLVERAAERYRTAEAFCADFRQELSVPLLNQRAEGRGRLCQRRPNLFSMRFTEPEGDLLVVDGTSVWLYYPSRDPRQVIKAPLSAAGEGRVMDFHREFLEDADRKYEIRHDGMEEVAGVATHRVVLRPKERARYREAVLWIGSGRPLVHRVEIREENGSVRTLHLSGVDLSPRIPDGTFSFTPPPGVTVISP